MSTLEIVLVVILVVVVFGWFFGRGTYGGNAYYTPGFGIVGLLLLILLILFLTGSLGHVG